MLDRPTETTPADASGAMPEGDVAARADPPVDYQRELLSFGSFLIKFALLVLVIRTLLVSSFNIPSESMQPRLLIGDYLIVDKTAYGWSRHSLPFALDLPEGRILARSPARGDVVVVKHPIDGTDYIKRVIGVGGDRVQLIDGEVWLNGRPLPRAAAGRFDIPATENMREASYGNPCFRPAFEEMSSTGELWCHYPRFRETLPGGRSYPVLDLMLTDADTTGVYEVPQGHLFLMGDNRDRSQDSRFPATAGGGIGIVPEDRLVGRAWVTIFSTDGSAVWYNPLSWFRAARWERIGEGF